MLLDVGALGFDSFAASERLLERGKIAATDATGDRFVRLLFSTEPAE